MVDNGSTDDSVKVIKATFPCYTLIETGENLGFAGGNNVGIEAALKAGATHVLLLNNDTVVDKGFLDAFLKQNDPIMGAKIYLESDPNRFDHIGGRWNKAAAKFDLIGAREVDQGQYDEPCNLDYACGACLFIKKEVLETVGLLENAFFLFWEESDFCARAKNAGFLVRLCPQAKIWHKVSASFSGKAHTHYFYWRNRWLYMQRNLNGKEKQRSGTIAMRELLHILKLYLIKSLFRRSAKNRAEYRSALIGSYHYATRRFGNAPESIYK